MAKNDMFPEEPEKEASEYSNDELAEMADELESDGILESTQKELTIDEKIDRKLADLGIMPKYAKMFREKEPKKNIYSKGNMTKGFFQWLMDHVDENDLGYIEREAIDEKFREMLDARRGLLSEPSTDEMEEPKKMSGKEVQAKLIENQKKTSDEMVDSQMEEKPSEMFPEEPKKVVEETMNETQPSSPIPTKRGKIVLINGYEGSGKTVEAGSFPKPFFICLEKAKFLDTIEYPPIIVPEFANFKENKDYIIANVIKNTIEDKQATYNNVLKWVNWFKNQNEKQTLVLDTSKALWDIAWGKEEQKKGKKLGKPEFIPITQELKEWVLDLIHWCRENGRNLIFTSHTTGRYVDINQYESMQIGEDPDAKYWIREAVSWRIDLLKPDQTRIDGKFIADFQKAPGRQYFKIDITGKKLFDIIDDKELLAREIDNYEAMYGKKEEDDDEMT